MTIGTDFQKKSVIGLNFYMGKKKLNWLNIEQQQKTPYRYSELWYYYYIIILTKVFIHIVYEPYIRSRCFINNSIYDKFTFLSHKKYQQLKLTLKEVRTLTPNYKIINWPLTFISLIILSLI